MRAVSIGPFYIIKKMAREFNETMKNIPFTSIERLKKDAEEFERTFFANDEMISEPETKGQMSDVT